jgi:hypothetical protein
MLLAAAWPPPAAAAAAAVLALPGLRLAPVVPGLLPGAGTLMPSSFCGSEPQGECCVASMHCLLLVHHVQGTGNPATTGCLHGSVHAGNNTILMPQAVLLFLLLLLLVSSCKPTCPSKYSSWGRACRTACL